MSSASVAPTPAVAASKATPHGTVRGATASGRRHLAWLVGGFVLAFAVPYLLADRLELGKDLYYGLYGAAVIALCAAWMRDTQQLLTALVSRRWRWALALGVFA